MFNKKGVSDVVTVILTIMITIAAIAIIWVAITPMLKERVATSSSCYDANIAISDSGYTCYDKTNNISLVQITRGSSKENITSYKFIVSSEGNSYNYQKDEKLEPNSALVFSLNTTGINSIDRISLIPVVTDGRTEKDCSVVFIDNVKSCALNQQEISELTILQQNERTGSGGGNNNNNPPEEQEILPPINVNACTKLNETGRTYILQNNIFVSEEQAYQYGQNIPCIEITKDGITLDGNNKYLVYYGNDQYKGIGISIEKDTATIISENVTIKNLNIEKFNVGIKAIASNNLTIISTNVTNNSQGISLLTKYGSLGNYNMNFGNIKICKNPDHAIYCMNPRNHSLNSLSGTNFIGRDTPGNTGYNTCIYDGTNILNRSGNIFGSSCYYIN